MERIYTADDADPAELGGRIAIIGYGSQGRAHARNLRDSGYEVIVGARPGGGAEKRAKADGFVPVPIAEAAKGAALIALLSPDMSHRESMVSKSRQHRAGRGFESPTVSRSISRDRSRRDVDIVLVAPKGPGDLVRREYEIDRGVPCLFAVQQDASGSARARALAYARGVGGTKGGAIETTFAEETETDLFGEQAVLCGGATELVVAGFQTLIEAGYKPEVAYFECLHELKLIVDLMYEGGIAKMLHFISETAKYGDFVSGPRVINNETRARMREVLADIRTGKFAQAWIEENKAGKPNYQAMYDADLAQPIEKVGARLRTQMAWLQTKPDSQAA